MINKKQDPGVECLVAAYVAISFKPNPHLSTLNTCPVTKYGVGWSSWGCHVPHHLPEEIPQLPNHPISWSTSAVLSQGQSPRYVSLHHPFPQPPRHTPPLLLRQLAPFHTSRLRPSFRLGDDEWSVMASNRRGNVTPRSLCRVHFRRPTNKSQRTK